MSPEAKALLYDNSGDAVMTAGIGRINNHTVALLRKRAKEANAIASALYEDGYRAASHEATEASLLLASAAHALETKLGRVR